MYCIFVADAREDVQQEKYNATGSAAVVHVVLEARRDYGRRSGFIDMHHCSALLGSLPPQHPEYIRIGRCLFNKNSSAGKANTRDTLIDVLMGRIISIIAEPYILDCETYTHYAFGKCSFERKLECCGAIATPLFSSPCFLRIPCAIIRDCR